MLNRAHHRLNKRANRELMATSGISVTQGGALAFLIGNDGCLLKELSAGLGLNNSAITGLVERMERAGLIEKRTCDRDSRSFRVYITQRGLDAAVNSLSLLKKMNGAIEKSFTSAELDVIARFLNFLADAGNRDVPEG